jgi:hypothetical protein
MSITEILDEIPKLNANDRWAIWRRLTDLETHEEFTPTDEMLAAIDEGLQSANNAPRFTIEEIQNKIEQCIRESK